MNSRIGSDKAINMFFLTGDAPDAGGFKKLTFAEVRAWGFQRKPCGRGSILAGH